MFLLVRVVIVAPLVKRFSERVDRHTHTCAKVCHPDSLTCMNERTVEVEDDTHES